MELLGKARLRETWANVSPFRDFAINSKMASPRSRAGTVGVLMAGKMCFQLNGFYQSHFAADCEICTSPLTVRKRQVSNTSESGAASSLILNEREERIECKESRVRTIGNKTAGNGSALALNRILEHTCAGRRPPGYSHVDVIAGSWRRR